MEQWKVYKTKVNTTTPDYQDNVARMLELVDELNKKLEECRFQGKVTDIKRHHARGKLLARDRLELLLDPDTPFIELCPMAGYGDKDLSAGGSCVSGIGLVNGVECMVGASIPTIKGGASNEATVKRYQRMDQIVSENRLPSISLVESAGADLRQQARVFHAGGAIFHSLTRRSQQGCPSISVVFGSSTAGGAYTPGMSDYVVMVKKQAQVYLAGPPLVKMATGEITDHETLGGAEMHSKVSGVSDYLADDEFQAIQMARDIIGTLNFKKRTPLPPAHLLRSIEPPAYDPQEILGIASADVRKPYDCREIMARLVDGSRMSEFKPLFGSTLVTVWAKIHGFPVGILGNNGVLFSDAANKATQFIELCDRRGIPLLFLQNITGFMVGTKYEQEGIIKHGSKMINAVSNRSVPAITILVGASYGAGNYAMCGRAYNPRFLFAWPNAKIAVMGSDQLVGVLTQVQREGVPKEMLQAMSQKFKQQVDTESSVWWCTSRLIDDGVIDPRDTRDILGMCYSVIYNSEIKDGGGFYGVHRM